MQKSMSFAAAPLANHSVSPDFGLVLLTRAETSCSPILPSLNSIAPVGWSGKTCPVSCPATEDGTLVPSSGAWANSGMGSPTECLTLNTVEHAAFPALSPKEGAVCSLSDVLVAIGDVPQECFLTPKACAGILRRAEKRGKVLPTPLARALRAVAGR